MVADPKSFQFFCPYFNTLLMHLLNSLTSNKSYTCILYIDLCIQQKCQQNNSHDKNDKGLLKIRLMGNLEINSSDKSQFARKPIFTQNNSFCHQELSRSLSPYSFNASRLKSSKFLNMKSSYINYKQDLNNKVYLDRKMIKSVIKDYSPNNRFVANLTPTKKSCVNTTAEKIGYKEKKFDEAYYFPQRQREREKYFQQSNLKATPTRDKFIQCNICYESSNVDQNDNIIASKCQTKKELFSKEKMKDISVSTINKQNHQSVSKFLGSDKTSGRNHFEGHLKPWNQQCSHCKQCCLKFFQQLLSSKDDHELPLAEASDNTPTERRKQIGNARKAAQNQDKRHHIKNISMAMQNEREFEKKQMLNQSISQNNREKCQQIIKRVRNFNQFLNEVKAKLKKESEHGVSQNTTIDNFQLMEGNSHQQSWNSSIQNLPKTSKKAQVKGKNSIKLALKLENQKIELQKYRKLVERELSKQHSIESIHVEQNNKRQKIITINLEEKTKKEKSKKPEIMRADRNSSVVIEDEEKQKYIQSRMSKINNLFIKMEGINKQQSENYRQINKFLQKESFEDEEDFF